MTCNFCQKMPLPANARAGVCSSCSKPTASSAITLCPTCSNTQKRCSRCGRADTANPFLQNGLTDATQYVCAGDTCDCNF